MKHGITDILYPVSILSLVESIRILILLKVAPMTGAVAVVLHMYNYGLWSDGTRLFMILFVGAQWN